MNSLSGFRMVHPAFPGKDVPVNHSPPFRGRGEGTRISNIQYSIFDIQNPPRSRHISRHMKLSF